MKLLNKILVVSLFFTAWPALAAYYCSTDQPTYNVDLGEININPGAQDGDVVAQSGDISKTVSCAGAAQNTLIAALKGSNVPIVDGMKILIPGREIYGQSDGKCQVMESGYPGLGIAWYNYNSGTKRWQCFSFGVAQGRGLDSNGSVAITDIIYLVKTGKISDGAFDFNQTFPIYETGIKNFLPDYGLLYKITLSGNTKISAPTCTAVAQEGTGQYQFGINDALNQTYSTEDRQVNISCDGYIANGTEVQFQIKSSDGVFALDSNYFATSDDGLGVLIKYKTETDSSDKTLQPTGRVTIPINNNKGIFGLKFIPYVKSGSGIYPLSTDNRFNISIEANGLGSASNSSN